MTFVLTGNISHDTQINRICKKHNQEDNIQHQQNSEVDMKAYVPVHLWSLKHTSLQASSCSHLRCDVLIADTLSSTCKPMVYFRSACQSYPIHSLHGKIPNSGNL